MFPSEDSFDPLPRAAEETDELEPLAQGGYAIKRMQNGASERYRLTLSGDRAPSLKESIVQFSLPTGEEVFAATHRAYGKMEGPNQDRIVLTPYGRMAVIDGFGEKGREAAELLEKALASPTPEESVQKLIATFQAGLDFQASGACFMHARIEQDPKTGKKMLHLIQAGDVAAIVYGRDGEIKFRSRDENLATSCVEEGVLTPDQALCHKSKHVVTNSVTGRGNGTVTRCPPQPLEKGDRLIIASDGLTDNCTPEELGERTSHLSPRGVIGWIDANIVDGRMKNEQDILSRTVDRALTGMYADGYVQPPKQDNIALIVTEIV